MPAPSDTSATLSGSDLTTPPESADEIGHIETRKGRKIRHYLRSKYLEHPKGSH